MGNEPQGKSYKGYPSLNRDLGRLGLSVKDVLKMDGGSMEWVRNKLEWIKRNPNAKLDEAEFKFRQEAVLNNAIADAFARANSEGKTAGEVAQQIQEELPKSKTN